jgi:hypothetical protein
LVPSQTYLDHFEYVRTCALLTSLLAMITITSKAEHERPRRAYDESRVSRHPHNAEITAYFTSDSTAISRPVQTGHLGCEATIYVYDGSDPAVLDTLTQLSAIDTSRLDLDRFNISTTALAAGPGTQADRHIGG